MVVGIVAHYVNVLFHLPLGEALRTPPNPHPGGLLALTFRFVVINQKE